MRREERVAVQGPVKEQQPDGMSHRGAGPDFPKLSRVPVWESNHRMFCTGFWYSAAARGHPELHLERDASPTMRAHPCLSRYCRKAPIGDGHALSCWTFQLTRILTLGNRVVPVCLAIVCVCVRAPGCADEEGGWGGGRADVDGVIASSDRCLATTGPSAVRRGCSPIRVSTCTPPSSVRPLCPPPPGRPPPSAPPPPPCVHMHPRSAPVCGPVTTWGCPGNGHVAAVFSLSDIFDFVEEFSSVEQAPLPTSKALAKSERSHRLSTCGSSPDLRCVSVRVRGAGGVQVLSVAGPCRPKAVGGGDCVCVCVCVCVRMIQ